MSAEKERLAEARAKKAPWKKWGPYLSERQWGTVREDYSDGGNAWDYFTTINPLRAYRWGEDGIAGVLRRFSAALLRAALLGMARIPFSRSGCSAHQQRKQSRRRRQGVLLYLDSTPTHSYMKYL